MKKMHLFLLIAAISLTIVSPASAYIYQDNFETNWSGDYAPNWMNSDYRHGASPIAKMEQSDLGYGGSSHGLKLTASSTPETWQWWAGVNVTNISHEAMATQYNPYVKVQYYDQTGTIKAGQLFAVPDLVTGSEDWTDAQIGGRTGNDAWGGNYSTNYYSVAAPGGWQDSAVARAVGWHELKIQLSSGDNKIHFYLDGAQVGVSARSDYTNLGTELGLYARFNSQAFGGTLPQDVYFDNFEVGSSSPVPLPGTLLLLGSGLAGLGFYRRRKAAARNSG